MKAQVDTDRFPEWRPFADAVARRHPDTGTWGEAWAVRDIVAIKPETPKNWPAFLPVIWLENQLRPAVSIGRSRSER